MVEGDIPACITHLEIKTGLIPLPDMHRFYRKLF